MKWNKKGIKSLTGNEIHTRPEQFLAEVVTINKYPESKNEDRIWTHPLYKKCYQSALMALRIRINNGVDFELLHSIIKDAQVSSINHDFDELIIKFLKN